MSTESLDEITHSITMLLGETRMQEKPTLRDHFAMAALTGEMAAQDESFDYNHWDTKEGSEDALAKSAAMFYRMADAMLKARKKEETEA